MFVTFMISRPCQTHNAHQTTRGSYSQRLRNRNRICVCVCVCVISEVLVLEWSSNLRSKPDFDCSAFGSCRTGCKTPDPPILRPCARRGRYVVQHGHQPC